MDVLHNFVQYQLLPICGQYTWRLDGTKIVVDAEQTTNYTPESPLILAYNELSPSFGLPQMRETESWLMAASFFRLSTIDGFILRLCSYWDGESGDGPNSIYKDDKRYGAQIFEPRLRATLCELLLP